MAVNTVRYQLKNQGINSVWLEIVRIGNTQKVVTTAGTNTYNKTVTTRRCSQPNEKLTNIYNIFTPEHTPFVEFGRGMLGSAWDAEEWNRFYNFMLWCLQLYKTDGFVQYPKSNLNERKLKNEVDIEFIDFMDNEVERNKRLEKMKMLESARKIISAANGGGKPLSSHTFHKWIKRYCTGNGLFLNPHIHRASTIKLAVQNTTPLLRRPTLNHMITNLNYFKIMNNPRRSLKYRYRNGRFKSNRTKRNRRKMHLKWLRDEPLPF